MLRRRGRHRNRGLLLTGHRYSSRGTHRWRCSRSEGWQAVEVGVLSLEEARHLLLVAGKLGGQHRGPGCQAVGVAQCRQREVYRDRRMLIHEEHDADTVLKSRGDRALSE